VKAFIREELARSCALLDSLRADEALLVAAEAAASICVGALRRGGKILLAGNGGSASDAQHLAGELVGRLNFERPGLAALALTADSAVLTAVGNDYGYERIFARQVEALGRAGDAFVGFSTSGRSANVLAALRTARARGLATIGFAGRDGGDMPPLCDATLVVRGANTQNIQEGHIVLGHILCAIIERELSPPRSSPLGLSPGCGR
jgi:D-sedoheptulose 7-phosphate isomerase